MTQFLQRKNLSDGRKGARFKKRLTTDEVGYGERIIDAGISSHYSDVFDGQFKFFPAMTVDDDGDSLEIGKAPIGNDHASVSYLLQFPVLSPPSYGSADLDSINVHLHMEDMNYRNSYNLPDVEIYKFKKSLPFVGQWGALRTRTGDSAKPERILIGSANYSEGPTIIESFHGNDESEASSYVMPSLFKGIGSETPTFYSTLDEAYEIDSSKNSYRLVAGGGGMFGVSGDKNDRSGRNTKNSYSNAYTVNWDGYGKVVRYEVDSKHMARPTSQGGLKKTWGDDPAYYLPYYNYNYAVSIGRKYKFRKELIHNKSNMTSSMSTSDAAVDTNLKQELHAATMSPDNTFFDDIFYSDMNETQDTTTEGKESKITAISHPHFSTAGGSGSGQVGRLYSRIEDTDDPVLHMFKGDKSGAMHICLQKQIPKPLRLARINGSDTDMNQMRIRIKFCINNMAKSHRSGLLDGDVEAHVVGCNILRSFSAILSTRKVETETFGQFINKLNTGDTTSVGYGAVDYNGEFDADSMAVTKDGLNNCSISNTGNSQTRVNFYNGVSIMNFVHGRGFQLTCDTNTDAANKATHTDTANKTPKVGMRVSGTGVPENAYINAVTNTTTFTLNENFTAQNDSVVLTFHDGRLDEDFGESQSNADADDGTFTMFHTGNPDSTTRQNNWDGYYQCSVATLDSGVCDMVPFVHKETATSTGTKNMSRDRGTFTQDHDDIVSAGPNPNAFVKLDDETTGYRVDKKQWYYLDAYLNQDAPTVCWVVSDSKERVIGSVKQAHSGSVLTTTNNTHADDAFPNFLTLWVNNIRIGMGRNGGNSQPDARGEKITGGENMKGTYSERQTSEVDILIENITISNFEPAVSNSSYIPGRQTVPSMYISGTRADNIPDLGSITIGEQIPNLLVNDIDACAPTYLSWGAETDIWTNKKNHIFMGGFESANARLEDASDAEKRMRFNTSGSDSGSAIRFFTTAPHANQPMGFGAVSKGNENCNQGVNLNNHVNIGRSAVRSIVGEKMMVDSFTKKGFFTITNPDWEDDAVGSGTDGTWTSKENPMFCTKILEWDVSAPYDMTVAQPSVLSAFPDDKFIIFRAGYTFGNDFKRTDVQIAGISTDGKVKLRVPTGGHNPTKTDGNGPLCHPSHMSELYIGPQKYWLLAELYNENSDNHALGQKTYTHSAVLSDRYSPDYLFNHTGLTYKETRYSDTTISSNQWFHVSNAGDQSSLLETKLDYGFGSFSDEKSQGYDGEGGLGYLNKFIPATGENVVDIGGLVEVEKTRATDTDENITLLIKSSIESDGGNTIVTTKYDDAAKHPSLTYVYRDELPTVTGFEVKPFEADPFYPEFHYKTNDEDLWYGFLILDNEIIEHQYHKAIMHIPFNEEPSLQKDEYGFFEYNTGKENFAYTYIRGGTHQYGDKDGDTREIGSREFMTTNYGNTLQDIVSIEGLAGNCYKFTGNDYTGGIVYRGPIIEYPLSTYGSSSQQNQLSLVAHFTVDDLTKIDAETNDKAYIIDDSNDAFGIWVDSTGKVNASVKTDDATTTCTLTSSYTVPVGNDIPTNVIVTVDVGLETGNVKLFVNGKLEDQTGRKTTDGSANNWKTGQNVEGFGILRIGSEYIAGGLAKNLFNGKIEEMVIYDITIYPINPKDGKITIYKPIQELTGNSTIAAGRPVNAKLFIKDYHNIRGTTIEEVAQTSQISIKKSGLGLKTST